MLTLPPSTRIFLGTEPVDMRKSFDGLVATVRHALEQEPLDGHLFVFFNKRRDHVRVLFWDRSGFCIFAKRLEKGAFSPPKTAIDGHHVEIETADLGLILEGIDLAGSKRRKRWRGGENIHPTDPIPVDVKAA